MTIPTDGSAARHHPDPPPASTRPVEATLRAAAAPTITELVDLPLRALVHQIDTEHIDEPDVVVSTSDPTGSIIRTRQMSVHKLLRAVRQGPPQALGNMRRLGVVGPQAEPLRALCDAASMAQQWDLAETAARELRVLLASNGEIIKRTVADNTLATVALAQGDPAAAARHVRAGLAVISRTQAVYALDLDHSLLTAARVARALDRPDMAARLCVAREQRLRRAGLVDPLPVTRLVDRETTSLSTEDVTNGRRSDGEAPTDEQSLVQLAIDAIAT